MKRFAMLRMCTDFDCPSIHYPLSLKVDARSFQRNGLAYISSKNSDKLLLKLTHYDLTKD